jgi:hypothetical protein
MKIGGNYSVTRRPVPRTARSWRVEKPNASDNPSEDSQQHPRQALAESKTATPSRISRCGTRVIDVEQQLPQPTFIAQLLGQMLGTIPDGSAALRAYTQNHDKKPPSRFTETA